MDSPDERGARAVGAASTYGGEVGADVEAAAVELEQAAAAIGIGQRELDAQSMRPGRAASTGSRRSGRLMVKRNSTSRHRAEPIHLIEQFVQDRIALAVSVRSSAIRSTSSRTIVAGCSTRAIAHAGRGGPCCRPSGAGPCGRASRREVHGGERLAGAGGPWRRRPRLRWRPAAWEVIAWLRKPDPLALDALQRAVPADDLIARDVRQLVETDGQLPLGTLAKLQDAAAMNIPIVDAGSDGHEDGIHGSPVTPDITSSDTWHHPPK